VTDIQPFEVKLNWESEADKGDMVVFPKFHAVGNLVFFDIPASRSHKVTLISGPLFETLDFLPARKFQRRRRLQRFRRPGARPLHRTV